MEASGSDYERIFSIPQQFFQEALNDLIWDFDLFKKTSKLIRLITIYRTREMELVPYLNQDKELVYRYNILRQRGMQ